MLSDVTTSAAHRHFQALSSSGRHRYCCPGRGPRTVYCHILEALQSRAESCSVELLSFSLDPQCLQALIETVVPIPDSARPTFSFEISASARRSLTHLELRFGKGSTNFLLWETSNQNRRMRTRDEKKEGEGRAKSQKTVESNTATRSRTQKRGRGGGEQVQRGAQKEERSQRCRAKKCCCMLARRPTSVPGKISGCLNPKTNRLPRAFSLTTAFLDQLFTCLLLNRA